MGSATLILLVGLVATCLLEISSTEIAEPFYKEVYPAVDLTGDLSNHLFFALVQSFGAEFNGSGNIAGIKVALDRINNDSRVLPHHVLHYTLTDSQCDRTIALEALFKQLLSDDDISKVAVVGCGCSVATEPTAEVSHYYNVTHISCSSASTELTDRTRFRRYFQLLQTMVDIARIYEGLINHYQWKYVSLVTQNENLYTVAIDSLKVYLRSNEIGYSEKLFESNTSIAGLGEPIDPGARVFIVASYERHARAFLCEAYKQGISYPSHLLILMGWYEGKWWLTQTEDLSCTPEQRESILEHALTVHHFNFYVPDDMQTTSGITGLQFKREEEIQLQGPPTYNKIQFSPYCYDAIWTLAYALNQTLQEYSSSDIQYRNNNFHSRLFGFVNESNFDGITGPVRFNGEGIRATNNYQVFQLRSQSGEATLDMVQVGEVVERSGEFQFDIFPSFSEETVLWPAGVPRDGVAVNTTVTLHVATTTVFVILATAGILFTAACLTFNFIFRGKKLIKLSSPNLNYLIGVGAIILYVDIYVRVVPTIDLVAVRVLCSITPWLTAIGYSLCYGTIVAKMIRVHYIFNSPKPNSSNSVKDWKLAVGILVLVVIDLIILITYTSIEGAGGVAVKSTINKENPSRSDEVFGVVEYHYILICKSKARDIFLGVLYGYKALLQIIALILAFSTRKVKVKGLNDTLYIAAAIYITSLLWGVVIVSTYSLTEYLNIFSTVFSLGLLVGTSAIISLVFIPKMIALYKDPAGEKIFSSATGCSMNTWNNGAGGVAKEGNSQEEAAEMSTLRKRVIELEQTLAQMQKNKENGGLHTKI